MGSDVNEFHFRLVLLGSCGTGFLFKKFEPKHKPTVEDLFTKEFDLGMIEIKVDFLDTSGSMQFPAMRRLSITNGDAFLIVYSVDDESSFEVLKMCIQEIQETRKLDYQEIPIIFVGNKSDLPKEMRRVPKELVSNFVYYELPRLRTKVIECSCKENLNVDQIFRSYLGLARVTVSPAYTSNRPSSSNSTSSSMLFGYFHHNNQMATIQSSGRSSHNNSGKKSRPSSAVPGNCANSSATNELTGGGGDSYRWTSNQTASALTTPPHSNRSSFRVALGVRKSCDASIVTSMRKISLSSPRNSREQLETTHETAHDETGPEMGQTTTTPLTRANCAPGNLNNNNNSSRANSQENDNNDDLSEENNQTPPLEKQQPLKSSIESILKAAIQNQAGGAGHFAGAHNNLSSSSKLNVNNPDSSKPRSRSLIWRPNRKSSRSLSNDQSTECRVS